MKVKKEVKQRAKKLLQLSIAADGTISQDTVDRVLQYILSLPKSERLAQLKAYKDAVARYINSHSAIIEVAELLAEEDLQKLQQKLAGSFSVAVKHNPHLIGGIRITRGDTIYDDSVAHKLQQIAAQMQ